MSEQTANRFIEALGKLEAERDLTDGEGITRFCAYFDAGRLGRELTGRAHV